MKNRTSFFVSKKQIIICLILASFCLPNAFVLSEKPDMTQELLVKYKNQKELVKEIVFSDKKIDQIVVEMERLEEVEYAEPNHVYHMSIIPSDTHYTKQWYLKRIKADQAWNEKREANDIVIAVIDSGVQINHPDLKDNIWRNKFEAPGNGIDDDRNGFVDDVNGWDFVNGVADPNPKFSEGYTVDGIIHGTIVAGVVAGYGNNGTGISGVVWQTKIMPLKVLDDKGAGDTASVIKAIDYAINNGADIINLSFVGFGYSRGLENAIRRAYNKGIIVVAAAGNDQGDGEGVNIDEKAIYPACHDGLPGENMVIGVSATDPLDQKASFSSYGSRCVDIAAPGVSIFSTSVFAPEQNKADTSFSKHYDGFWSGTSMAAPMVSGAAALVESTNPRLSRLGAQKILIETSDNINQLNPDFVSKLGQGRLNIQKSVQRAKALINHNESLLLLGGSKDIEPVLKLTNKKGESKKTIDVFNPAFRGGIRVAGGDVNGDGMEDIVVGAGPGGGPHVRIFNKQGEVIGQFFAYNKNFRGGVNVAVGDVDGDGVDEIIVGAGNGGGPHIRVFEMEGKVIGHFFAYDKNFRGGVNVAVGDVNGDQRDEIIAGAGKGGGPHVRIFRLDGSLVNHFFAYDKNFRGGVRVATMYNNSGADGNLASIVTAPGEGGEPRIIIFSKEGQRQRAFYAFHKKFKGGVNIATGDFDNDGYDEIVTAAGKGGTPHIRIFDRTGVLRHSFFAYDENYNQGVEVGVFDVSNIVF